MYEISRRQSKLILYLLSKTAYSSYESLVKTLNISKRMIQYDFAYLEPILNASGITIERKRNSGIRLIGNQQNLNKMLIQLKQADSLVLEGDDRTLLIVLVLLTNEFVTYEDLGSMLQLSRQTMINHIHEVDRYLMNRNLVVLKQTGRGLRIAGDEVIIRSTFFECIMLLQPHYPGDGVFQDLIISVCALEDEFNQSREFIQRLQELSSTPINAEAGLDMQIAYVFKRINLGNIIQDAVIAKTKGEHLDELKILIQQQVSNSSEHAYLYQLVILNLNSQRIDASLAFSFAHADEAQSLANFLYEKLAEVIDVSVSEKTVFIDGLARHLQVALYRMYNGLAIKNEMTKAIRLSIPLFYDFTSREIRRFYRHQTFVFDENEIAYISMYIASVFEEKLREHQPMKILIICAFGIATSSLLMTRLRQIIPDQEILGPIALQDMSTWVQRNDIDLIISTSNLPMTLEQEVIVVNPLLYPEDVDRIKESLVQSSYLSLCRRVLYSFQNSQGESDTAVGLGNIIPERNIAISDDYLTWQDAIRHAASPLVSDGSISSNYVEKMIEAVINLGTYMILTEGTAYVHAGVDDGIVRHCLSLLVLRHPVIFGESESKRVSNIVVLGLKDKDNDNFIDLVYIFENKRNQEKLKSETLAIADIVEMRR